MRPGRDVDLDVPAMDKKGMFSVFSEIKSLQVWSTLPVLASNFGAYFGVQCVFLLCESGTTWETSARL